MDPIYYLFHFLLADPYFLLCIEGFDWAQGIVC